MTAICTIIVVAIFIIIATLVTVEYIEECKMSKKYQQYEIDKLNEIYELDSKGICNSCNYGKDKCLLDGEPYCKKKEKKHVKQKRSI